MRKRKHNKKEISNMIKLAGICIGFIVFVLLLRKWYLNNIELENNIPVLEGVVTHQIKANEFTNYINDNDTAIIYMCTSRNEKCRTLEEKLKPWIKNNSLEDIIVYLDLTSATDREDFFDMINKTYPGNEKIKEEPTILYFENGNLSEVLSGSKVTVENFEKLLKDIQVIL